MKKIIFFCLFFTLSLLAVEKKTICLNMIVKNEKQVIERCLGSLKHLIDYWVIVDTGSTDGTQNIIKNFLKEIPGELHERPWVNFSHNRNEALQLAKGKGDYLLLIDADEILQFSPNFVLPPLEKDIYFIVLRQLNAADAKRNGLINNHISWEWKGVIHEVLVSPEAKTQAVLQGVLDICDLAEGNGRSKDPNKYFKDALLLEEALLKEPNNSRYAHYLAVSYSLSDKLELAKKAYQKRIAMPSEDIQETYLAIYNLAQIHENLNEDEAALDTYFKAYAFRPSRAEPLFHAAVIYRKKGNYLLGYLLSQFALSLPRPLEDVCVEYMAYDYAILIEYANCTLLSGRFQEGYQACSKLLANPHLPAELRPQVVSNYEVAKKNLEALQAASPVMSK